MASLLLMLIIQETNIVLSVVFVSYFRNCVYNLGLQLYNLTPFLGSNGKYFRGFKILFYHEADYTFHFILLKYK